MAGSLEVFTSEESTGSSAVASPTRAADTPDWLRPLDPVLVAQIGIARRRVLDERAGAAAVAPVAPWQARRFGQGPARAGMTLAVFASLGLIGFVVIRVVLSLPGTDRRGLLESVGTVTIGGIVSVPAPLPIDPLAEGPPRTVRVAPERSRAAAIVPAAIARPVVPAAIARPNESPSPAGASTSGSLRLAPDVPASEPLARLPAAVARPVQPLPPPVQPLPPLAQPQPAPTPDQRPAIAAAAPISAGISGAATDRADIQALINRYQNALNNLNAGAAKTLWPSVDERTLGRAFDQLKRQEVVFDACQTAVTGLRAVSSCQGHASYVPKVGNKLERIEAASWTFKIRKSEGGWVIEGVESRAVSP
jgi:hypothetical protein